jgi:hypothetical protein
MVRWRWKDQPHDQFKVTRQEIRKRHDRQDPANPIAAHCRKLEAEEHI